MLMSEQQLKWRLIIRIFIQLLWRCPAARISELPSTVMAFIEMSYRYWCLYSYFYGDNKLLWNTINQFNFYLIKFYYCIFIFCIYVSCVRTIVLIPRYSIICEIQCSRVISYSTCKLGGEGSQKPTLPYPYRTNVAAF
jgi:hypothetical protein